MKLNAREKNIAIGLIIVVMTLGLWEVVLSPYAEAIDKLNKDSAFATTEQSDLKNLFDKRDRLQKVWKDIQSGGLKSNISDAASQLQHAIYDWESASGVHQTASKPERTTDVDQFTVLSYQLTETGSTWSIAKLLGKFETATFPVRVNEVQILPQKEGTDDLVLHLTISTLCQRNTGAAAGEVR